jgi:hypothetical protein
MSDAAVQRLVDEAAIRDLLLAFGRIVLEGEVELTVAGRTERLSAGAWSVMPGWVERGVRAGAGGARIVALVVPRGEAQP